VVRRASHVRQVDREVHGGIEDWTGHAQSSLRPDLQDRGGRMAWAECHREPDVLGEERGLPRADDLQTPSACGPAEREVVERLR